MHKIGRMKNVTIGQCNLSRKNACKTDCVKIEIKLEQNFYNKSFALWPNYVRETLNLLSDPISRSSKGAIRDF